jgi:hypothetical protein
VLAKPLFPTPEEKAMKRYLLTGAILVTTLGTVAATRDDASGSAAACKLQGVWRLERVVTNGTRTDSTSFQQRKIMTKNHFMWVNQENRRDTLPLKTYRDSVRVLSDNGGYGTYKVSGSTLTEHIELFPSQAWVGRDFKATCKTDANHWVHTWISDAYNDSTGHSRRDTTAEYYRRVE